MKKTINHNICCEGCYRIGRQDERKELIKKFDDLTDKNKIYPIDIFPELSHFQIETINDLLLSHLKFPLDRLSAHISRRILDGIRDKLKELEDG